MPRVLSFRVGLLWVAFCLNDYGEIGPRRFGLCRDRTVAKAAMAS